MKRFYEVKIIVENEMETLKEGMDEAKKAVSSLGLKVHGVKPVQSRRTLRQNDALHLWFSQLSEELQEHGLDMREILKDGFDFPATPYAIKEFIWRPTMKKMFGKKSTTQLDKTEEINRVWDVINRAITERTRGEVQVPPFPSVELLMER